MLKPGSVSVTVNEQKLSFDFEIAEDALARALDLQESRRLAKALLDQHGVECFAELADEIVEEYGS